MTYLAAALAVVWLAVFLYTVSLGHRARRLEAEVRLLQQHTNRG